MPTKIGRFEIQGQLSRSAFATVYKALDTETKQIIALKVVALNNLADRDDLVKTGDNVLFAKYAGTEVKLDGEEYLVIRESDLLAVVTNGKK